MLETLPWILIVQLWSDPPPKIQMIYRKEYPNYAECMQSRKEWDNQGFVAICSVKPVKEKQ